MASPSELEKRARKANKSLFSFFFGGDDEEPQDLFSRAANQYKQLHQWSDAARCYMDAALAGEKQKDYIFAASNYVEAANSLLKSDPYTRKHLEPLKCAASLYNIQGRFSQSGRIMKNAAERFESQCDFPSAIEFYKKAAEYYDLDEYGKAAHSQCLLKYADLLSQNTENYLEALQIYESEGHKNLKNALLQYGVREIFLKAGLLHILAADATDAQIAYGKYVSADPKFEGSREGRFLKSVVDACDSCDRQEYLNHVREYDSISKLDPWKAHVLYKIKETFPESQGSGVVGPTTTESASADVQDHVDLT